jgi:hypothetical protein
LNRAAPARDPPLSSQEGRMTEYADIFTYGLTSAVYILGSATMLVILACSMLVMETHPIAPGAELQKV